MTIGQSCFNAQYFLQPRSTFISIVSLSFALNFLNLDNVSFNIGNILAELMLASLYYVVIR